MAATLHQIIYLSRATAPLSDDAAAALCGAAAERNRGGGITGLLLHDERASSRRSRATRLACAR